MPQEKRCLFQKPSRAKSFTLKELLLFLPFALFFFSSSSAVPFPLSLRLHTYAQTTRGPSPVSLVSLWQCGRWGCAAASGSVLAIIRQREPLDQCPDPEHDDSKRPERCGPLEPRPTPEAGVEGQHHCREAQKRGTTHTALPRRPLDSRVARTLPQLCDQRPSYLLIVGLFLALYILPPCAGAAHCVRGWSSGGARRVERARKKKEASKSGRSQAVQIWAIGCVHWNVLSAQIAGQCKNSVRHRKRCYGKKLWREALPVGRGAHGNGREEGRKKKRDGKARWALTGQSTRACQEATSH